MVKIGQIGGDNDLPEKNLQPVKKENEWDKPILQFKGDVNGDGYVGADEIENEHGFNLMHIIGMRWTDVLERVGQFFGIKSATVKFSGTENRYNNNDITVDVNEQGIVTNNKKMLVSKYTNKTEAVYEKTNIQYDEHGYPIEFDIAQKTEAGSNTLHIKLKNSYNDKGQLIERIWGPEGSMLTREVYDYEKNIVTIERGKIENGTFVPSKENCEDIEPINMEGDLKEYADKSRDFIITERFIREHSNEEIPDKSDTDIYNEDDFVIP